jgi:trehalose synthase
VAPVIDQYDAVILTVEEYKLPVTPPQVFFMPAIDPFLIKNREMSEQEMERRLQYYKIPTDLPLVVQVSRFDRWKDPQGVIRAHKLARKRVDCRLVLLGNAATDDPEGEAVFESLLRHRDDRTLILPYGDDTALVNALQRRAAVVLQKSLREGFGLTVAEAMWKGTPVIGGDVGGIRRQIQDGENGFLVSSVEQAAERIVQVLTDGALRARLGAAAKETVRKRFLITRLLEQYLDLFNSFRTVYQLGAPEDAAAGI